MGWLSENRHWLLFAGVVLTSVGAVGLAAVGFVATLSVLVTGGSLVATVAAFLLGTLVLVGLDVVFAVALVRTLAGMARFPTNQRVANRLQWLESWVPPLSRLGLGDRFQPSVEERRAALTRKYVDGELTEHELEAALEDLLDDREADQVVEDITAVEDAPRDAEQTSAGESAPETDDEPERELERET